MKKPAPTYKLGDDQLLQLFDTYYLDNVCGEFGVLVKIADPAPNSEREAMADTLRVLLGVPIEALQERIIETGRGDSAVEWAALERFADAVEATAMRLPGPLHDDEARELARNLRTAWIEAGYYASAYRMYFDLPRELEANEQKTRNMIDRRREIANVESVDKDQVITEYAKLKVHGKRGLRAAVAKQFNIAPNTVKNIWNNRDRTKHP